MLLHQSFATLLLRVDESPGVVLAFEGLAEPPK